MPTIDTQGLQSVGWAGFLDISYMIEALAALALAVALGALIAFHPATRRMVDTLEEAELPKVCVLYSLIGAMVGVIVLEYGLVVGFVVFGLGGLMRFRSVTSTTRDTGRLILVTLLGLICGLSLPHFAVLAAVFAWVLIFIFDGHPVYCLRAQEIPEGRMKEAAAIYRDVLASLKCRIISENKSFGKRRIEWVFRAPRNSTQGALNTALCDRVPIALRGELDWEVA